MLLDSWVHISAQHMWWRICQWRSVEKLASFHIYNSAAIVENHLLTNLSGDWLYTTMGHWRLSCIIENARLGLCKIGYVILWHILHVTLGCSVNLWFLRSIINATIGEGLQLSQGKDDYGISQKRKLFDVKMCIICQIDGSQTGRMRAFVMPLEYQILNKINLDVSGLWA